MENPLRFTVIQFHASGTRALEPEDATALMAGYWGCTAPEAALKINNLFLAYQFESVVFHTDMGSVKYVKVA